MRQQSKAIYLFKEKYDHHQTLSRQEAVVRLEINYLTKTYSVTPDYGGDNFGFVGASQNWKMWKAVVKAIDEAIDFANSEVGNTPREGNV